MASITANGVGPRRITILGGGPAGLFVGYYASKSGLPFTIYEAKDRVGGNSITIKHGDFLFDSGPHLLQTKDIEVTNEITDLLQGQISKVVLPVQTYSDGKLVDFPFSPLNLLTTMGILFFARAAFQIARTRFSVKKGRNFEEFARHTYGKVMAERFLLNYSQRLWGLPCSELSPKIGGYKLRGLNITTFLIEVIRGRTAKVKHLGGTIYYPNRGFGTIAERLSEVCGARNVRTNSRVTSVFHDNFRIRAIELNGITIEPADEVVSTLPLNVLVQLMRPKLPEDVLTVAESLHFRALVLVVIFLKIPSVTESSSIHFPDPQVPFTRLHEPKNRSKSMAPDGQTSLVTEIPCQEGDEAWNMQDKELVSRVVTGLQKIQLIAAGEIIDGMVVRLDNAYPVLEVNYEQKIQQIRAYLDKFSNLKLTGRTGAFAYLSLHHIMKLAKSTVASYMSDKGYESERA